MTEERRRRPRFQIRQPISLELPHNAIPILLQGTTENVSMIGVLLTVDAEISENTQVNLTLTLRQPRTPSYPLHLPNLGTVIRAEKRPDGKDTIVIECDQAFELAPQHARGDLLTF
jgi:hypothetical protein